MNTTITPVKKKTRTRSTLKDQFHGYYKHNKVELVDDGRGFFDLLKKMIDKASSSIHFQTYSFGDDKTGTFVADALIAAAKKKVEVYLLIDGYASQGLSQEFQARLKKGGVHFRFFEPFLPARHFYFGRRLHHKVVVIDNKEALVGSNNIEDKYNDFRKERAWFDMALFIKGDVVKELQRICIRFWEGKKWRPVKIKEDHNERTEKFPEDHTTPIRVRQNDWINRKAQATNSYHQLFNNAKKTICVVCSYVLPGKKLRNELVRASRRGVKIKFILAGTSDVIVVKAAERYLYRWMFRHNVKLFEYQPTVLHAKMATADDEIMTIGSYNLNNLSAYASIELNLDIKDPEFVKSVQKEIDQIIKNDCNPVDLEPYTTSLISFKQFNRWIAYHITRLAEMLIARK